MKKKQSLVIMILTLVLVIVGLPVMESKEVSAASKVAINTTNIVMKIGQTRTLKITGTKQKVKWKSSKKSVVRVNSKGKITARKTGTATITATVNNDKYKCAVRVSKKNQKVLVAYFSHTGTTKKVASKIQKQTGGDLLRIVEKNKYSSDYDTTTARAQREKRKNARPAITSVVANMKDYDTIYIGYPIWWDSTPKVIDTFLAKYNLSGKTVIPFCTSGGSGISGSMKMIRQLCSGSTILEGYEADSGSTSEIQSWLRSIGK